MAKDGTKHRMAVIGLGMAVGPHAKSFHRSEGPC